MNTPLPRRLVIVLGDQLTTATEAFENFDTSQDAVWMAEVKEESTRVPSHKARTALFLSAMRHFKKQLEKQNIRVHYWTLDDNNNPQTLHGCLATSLAEINPQEVFLTEAGEWSIQQSIIAVLDQWGGPYSIKNDSTFYATKADFSKHAKGRKQLRMEYFYREMRQRFKVLLDKNNEPQGGQWNYDKENRESYGKSGPPDIARPVSFSPDDITKTVIQLVGDTFPDNPGALDNFDWPVTAEQAEALLDDFVNNRLPTFGQYQDAMWDDGLFSTGNPYHSHSKLSAALNLKLLLPRQVVQAVEKAYYSGNIPLASAEGFIRQVMGWREFIRGIYWQHMPAYLSMNSLSANQPLPEFYWTGETDMNCLRHTIKQTLDYGYAHHIQRLMVTGLFSLLLGVTPKEIHQWYLSIYIDAVEWVELPNTLGMSQYVDNGLFGSKPYVASGKYIDRMSNYCAKCAYKPSARTGKNACPFTVLYWDFLIRHEEKFARHPRMALQIRNVKKLDESEKKEISSRAREISQTLGTHHQPTA